MADVQSGDLVTALDEAALGRSHFRAVLASGMGFFTDAYDLFVIGIASALITKDWHLSSGQLAVLNSTMLAAAFLGAMVFGRYADVVGRKRVYWLVAVIMIAGALGAFIGVFLFPVLNSSLGLRGTLLLTAVISGLGFALTLVLPEPAGRSLDEITAEPTATATDTRPQPVARQVPAA